MSKLFIKIRKAIGRIPIIGYLFRLTLSLFLLPRRQTATRHTLNHLSLKVESLQNQLQNTNEALIELIDKQKNNS